MQVAEPMEEMRRQIVQIEADVAAIEKNMPRKLSGSWLAGILIGVATLLAGTTGWAAKMQANVEALGVSTVAIQKSLEQLSDLTSLRVEIKILHDEVDRLRAKEK